MKKVYTNYVYIFLFIALCACAKPILSTHMVPHQLEKEYRIYSGPLYMAIMVDKVGGGRKTDPMVWSEIGNPELRAAIIQSLKENNYLALNNNHGDYTLNVFLVEVDQPRGGFTISITTFVEYKVINNKNGKIIYDEIIDASVTKKISDAFSGTTRDRIAKEDSMKNNIGQFIRKLFFLNKE